MNQTNSVVEAWPDPPIPSGYVKQWEEFFRKKHHTDTEFNDTLFDMDLFPLQYRRELGRMLQVARTIQPKTVMEIGCDKCASLYHFCLIPSVERVIGCEIRGTPFSGIFEKNFPDIDFCWVKESRSTKTLLDVARFFETTHPDHCRGRIDVLFIDGDKCFYMEDFATYLPMMNEKGIVFMHDVSEGYPKEVFEVVGKRGYRTEYIRDTSEYDDFLRAGKEPQTAYEQWLSYWKGGSCGVGVIYLEK